MADEVVNSEGKGSSPERIPDSMDAGVITLGRSDSENNGNGEHSSEPSVGSLEHADLLTKQGDKASKDKDYTEATECYSRALEIRAMNHGELSPECVQAYYKFGCALLYKAQEEADPLGSVPRKEEESQQNSCKDEPAKSGISAESSVANPTEQGGTSIQNGKEEEDDDEMLIDNAKKIESDLGDNVCGDEEEDESDLDLAWKMLDVARAIVEKQSGDTMEKVDILSALAEVALEREDVETSLNDYLKALSILERLVEPDSRHIAELNFRICLCLEIGSRPQEAIPYCEKAISVCKSRVQRLTMPSSESTAAESSKMLQSTDSSQDNEAEIKTLTGLCSELEKKLEELNQLVSNPTSILQDILGIVAAKAKGAEKSSASVAMSSSQVATINSHGDFDSPTASTAHTTNGASGVTHLGVVGRGVKRVNLNPITSESKPVKRPSLDPPNNGEGSTS
ncbi:PREDICTED: NASP-related protein sim3 isoform X2 [Ipomoea nil]|uniref:NASP-related protein sim3 isoform X2 n=1 Tax=Ipomoea nil TaxID=35883 RepID=UPI000901F0DF|nr:PREDICTED: NASP-related protein sim3 isoform X2 [Ipomoea nil]